jgi:hypothetical protein
MERLKASADCWLSLAAAPTFAIMAFVTAAFGGGPQDLFCAAAQHASPLNGMAWMYLLMSAFHSAPWLKLMSGQRIISRSRLPWHGSDSPRRLAGRMVPPTSISGKSELNNHTFEPRLFEPKSRLPGNGILPAETKAPKRLRKAKETIAAT